MTKLFQTIGTIVTLLVIPVGAEVDRVERGSVVLENIPGIPAELLERLDQYQNTRSAPFADWLPHGGLLISTRFGETTQIHRIDTPLGARRQLTFFREPVTNAWVSPDPGTKGFLFSRDTGGDEFYQLYWFDLTTGSSRLLTDGRARHGDPIWSNRGDRFTYSSTRRDGRSFDIWIGSLEGDHNSHRMVHEGSGLWSAIDWAPDDKRLLVSHYISINESRLFVLELETNELRQINPSPESIGYGTARFTRDGRGVFVISDQGSEFRHLRHYDLESGRMKPISDHIPWDIEMFRLSRDGRYLAYFVNESGRSQPYLRDLAAGRDLPAPEFPPGRFGSGDFSPDGRYLALSWSTSQSPSDLFVYDLQSRELARWTESEVGGLDTAGFPTPELVYFSSFDDLEIPAWVYRPGGTGPHPVVVQIHGGPESQSRPGFSSLFAFWVNELGAAVVTPNVRGSSGYGKSYLLLDNGKLREDSVRDIGALLDWIATQPDLDSNRVIVYGGSYGGYMVLASLVHFSDRLLAGINIVGISNFVTFLENTESYRRDLRRAEYGDERDPEMRAFLESISPLTNAHRINRPLFVAQGYNDPRVPVTESEQIVRTVRANGGEVWYFLALDEGHGFAKKSNRDQFQAAAALFIQKLFDSGVDGP